MSHHANDGSASRVLRGLLREHGYRNDPGAELAAAAALDAKCRRGEHDETVVPANRVVYTGWPDNRRRETGERYCRRCGCTANCDKRKED